jgi:hypothetical protein
MFSIVFFLIYIPELFELRFSITKLMMEPLFTFKGTHQTFLGPHLPLEHVDSFLSDVDGKAFTPKNLKLSIVHVIESPKFILVDYSLTMFY